MSIQLKYSENFSEGLKRLIIDECDTALNHLRNTSSEEEKHEAVHEARKAFKKIRACLRLVRDEIDYYQEENKWFRDMGRTISAVRDANANLEALNVLKRQFDSQLYENSFNGVEKELKSRRKELAKKVLDQDEQLNQIKQALEDKIEIIPGWPLDIQSFDDIRPSIKRTYKRGYKGLHQAIESGKIEDFHEWRKRVKYLRYQIDILNRLWPQVFDVTEDEMHDITDFTGTLHDLHNLQNAVSKLDTPFEDIDEKILFDALIAKHQDIMQKHAVLKGRKFYVDSPDNFCDKMKIYWKTHKKEVTGPELPQSSHLEST